MASEVAAVKRFYDSSAEDEWARLGKYRFEFDINSAFIGKYLKPGDRVLDLGGGPGRYSLHFAEKGCDVTLIDLSDANVALAKQKAAERGLAIRAFSGDARRLSALTDEVFDHILLMGPMYHLTDAADRDAVMAACLEHLAPGGTLSVAFINSYGGMIYDMREMPEHIIEPLAKEIFYPAVFRNEPYAGPAFTEAYFARACDVLPYMERFPLEKLHFLSSEAMFAPCSDRLYAQSDEVYSEWLRLGMAICERPESLGISEHLLYIGKKQADG